MTPTLSLNEAVTALIEVLTDEKEYLLASKLDELPVMAEKKAHYADFIARYLEKTSVSGRAQYAPVLARVKYLAQENEKLLSAVKKGAGDARKRLDTILDREKSVGTYMESGYKLRVHDAGVTRQKIA